MNCVLNLCNLWALYVLLLCRDVWFPGDYLAKLYSLCDISILAPVFVMAYEFHLCDGKLVLSLWWQISSVFVTAYEFRLCDSRWVSSLWRRCHMALGWIFMLRYFKKALFYIVLIILVILLMKMNLLDYHWNSQSITCFVKCSLSWDLHFPPAPLIILLTGL